MLDVLSDEGLQAHAADVGTYFRDRLWVLARNRHIIGDIRGSGLFIGIDLVRDTVTRSPATEETSEVCTRMKEEHHVLMSIDGPHNNVLVIKPPLCFACKDVDEVIAGLDVVLGSLRGPAVSGSS